MLPSIPPDIDISPAERIRIDTRLSLIERERSVLERIATRVLALLDSLEAEQTRLEDRLAKPAVPVPMPVPVPDRQAMTASGTLTKGPEPAANDTPGVPTLIPVQATRPLYHHAFVPEPSPVRRRDTAPLVLR